MLFIGGLIASILLALGSFQSSLSLAHWEAWAEWEARVKACIDTFRNQPAAEKAIEFALTFCAEAGIVVALAQALQVLVQ
jgi:hypothetical protein